MAKFVEKVAKEKGVLNSSKSETRKVKEEDHSDVKYE